MGNGSRLSAAEEVEREREHRRQRKERRDSSKRAHPFGRELEHDAISDLYDDNAHFPAVLVAFGGREGLLGGSAPVDVFEALQDLPMRRIYVRNLVGRGPHPLGEDLAAVVEGLRARIARHSEAVFVGTSLGGYLALVLASILQVPQVIAVNPTTTLKPEQRAEAGDERWPEMSKVPSDDLLGPFADLAEAWRSGVFSPEVRLHFSYRNDVLRYHAENVAGLPNVHLYPHYEYLPMPKIRDDGTLRRQVAEAIGLIL